MAPSFTSRPKSGDSRPASRTSRAEGDDLVIPNRTSSLHSRITQPSSSQLAQPRNGQGPRAPKTLTHAYMVCGVGREPSQWVKAPAPSQGKVGHMKGAVGQFWLPEILGSSPRLEQDNEIARSLHSAMRVCIPDRHETLSQTNPQARHVSLMMLRFAPARVSPTAFTTLLFFSKIPHTLFTVLHFASGRAQTRSGQKQFASCVRKPKPTTTTLLARPIGFRTA